MMSYRLPLLVTLVVAFASGGCNSAQSEAAKNATKAEESNAAASPPPLMIQVAQPVWRKVQRTAQGQGALFAKESVVLSNKQAGYVSNVLVDFGDKVKAGQALAEMEREELALEVDVAASTVKQAEAVFIRAKGEHERIEELFAEEIVSPRQRDAAEAEYKSAAAAVHSAEKALALARKRLGDTRIVSPIDGFVQERFVNPGEYLPPASKLLEVVVVNPLKLRTTIPERYARLARIGLTLRVEVDALPGERFDGTLTRMAAGVEHATRSLLVEAEIPNPHGTLRPGYFAHVTGVLGEEPALFIPRSGLYRFAGVERVFVLKDNLVTSQEVKSGIEDGDFVEIAEGLTQDDLIAADALERLADGMTVRVAGAQ